MTSALTVQDMSSGKIPCILLAIVRRLTPCWMRPETEDLTQQALVRVAGAYRRDPSRTLNKSYLNQVARSVVLDHVRKHRDRTVTADTDVVDRAAACRTTDPELQAANGQTAAAIQQAVAALLPDRAAAVRLYLAGHSGPEIARQLGTSRKRVENLTYRGLKDLRANLAAAGFTPGA